MKFYQITASVAHVKAGWHSTTHVPTFYLRDDMQMIENATAAQRLAEAMLRALCPEALSYDVTVAVSEDFDPSVIGA